MWTTTTRRNLRSKLSTYLESKDDVDDDETSDNFADNNNRGIGNNGRRRRRTSWYDNIQQSTTKLDEHSR